MKRTPSLRMVIVALVVSLGGSFHFGYQLVITNPAQGAFIQFLNESLESELKIDASDSTLNQVWSLIVAILFLGALAGSFSIRLIADRVGRKQGLYVSIGIGVVSAGLSIGSKFIPSVIMYGISRVTMGYSVSLSLGLAALFLSESSPKECRGAIGMITGTCVQFGTVIGSIIAMPQIFGTYDLWYVNSLMTDVLFLPCLPETPGGAQSWASVVQMLSRFVIVTIFLPMKQGIGESWSYLILFVAPVVVSVIYLYFKLPETKNKTPIEVSEPHQLYRSPYKNVSMKSWYFHMLT
ncbi:unnamed protein product [Heligmosomoides polygyrus]|uniref:MFS domain-containing protein n=1 Tax=Heligmosomoides polygyrus TaxID=6339 RepID=A0A3P8DXS7_HELPZ|nr:unnamed protein product [Heligmosomoides polygyrus]